MEKLKLTQQQETALQQVKIFLQTPGSGVFILKGYAGTGKTTLLQQLGLWLKNEKKKFVMLAPTGRAATVLRAKTGLEAKTIHSELYTFSEVDGEPNAAIKEPAVDQYGQMRLMFTMRAPDPESNKIYIVDEASMISDEPADPTSYAHFGSGRLLSDLLHAVSTNKIIFSGDPCQLPPVGSLLSPALNDAYMRKQGKVVHVFELKEILRQKAHSGILQLATKVRRLTESSNHPKWIKLPARGLQQIQLASHLGMKNNYVQHIKDKGFDDTIAVCHSNLNCMDINKTVRTVLYNDALAPLQVGDLLMVTQNNHLIPLTNGDFVTVTYVGFQKPYQGIRFLEVTVQSHLSGKEYETLLCEEVLFNGQPNLTSEQQRTLMIDFSMRMRRKGVHPKSDTYLLALQSDPYLNSLRANFGYAVTCHKSQGGEWADVYLFLQKGMYSMGPVGLSRWWYTGVTRAKENLHLVDDWWIA